MWLWSPLGWLGALATAVVRLFLPRSAAGDAAARGLVISPADGRVSRDRQRACRRPSSALGDRPMARISIFMSVFDCHVNRSPVAGRIERIAYRAGLFLNADLDKASEDNERNCFVIRTASGARIGVVQIAGLVARRIVPFVREGDRGRRRRALRHDPVRLAARRLPPRRRPPAGRRRPDRDRRRDHHRRPARAATPDAVTASGSGRASRRSSLPGFGEGRVGSCFLASLPATRFRRTPPRRSRRRGGRRDAWCGARARI